MGDGGLRGSKWRGRRFVIGYERCVVVMDLVGRWRCHRRRGWCGGWRFLLRKFWYLAFSACLEIVEKRRQEEIHCPFSVFISRDLRISCCFCAREEVKHCPMRRLDEVRLV